MKKVQLTMEEWQRLAAITPNERERALKKLRRGASRDHPSRIQS